MIYGIFLNSGILEGLGKGPCTQILIMFFGFKVIPGLSC